MVVADDEYNSALILQLYNQEKELATDGRLVEGTVMIVKEPYLKVLSDGPYGIRVDHLSDVKFLLEHDSRVPSAWRNKQKKFDSSANVWKTKGNDAVKQAKYHLAIDQ